MSPLRIHTAVIALCLCQALSAQTDRHVAQANSLCKKDCPEVEVSALANVSSGRFAPYFISALRHGKVTQKTGAYIDASITQHVDTMRRLSYGYGAEVLAGAATGNNYLSSVIVDPGPLAALYWQEHRLSPPNIWLQQLYGEVKYRAVFVTAGLKEYDSPLLNSRLSSGDLIESGNARPVPQLRAGFIDFVDVPFLQGWVQINGALAYGMMADDRYNRDHNNRYNYHLTEHALYNYKYCYFRFAPDQPLSVTAGMQSAGFFGGKSTYYVGGYAKETEHHDVTLKSFFNMLIPVLNSGEKFAEGSTLGTWDFYVRYRLRDGTSLGAYFQWPFEDGSGIARRNKMDGLWGVEYSAPRRGLLTGAVVEYLDTRDQSGPIHFAPGDYDRPDMTTEATGRDNYYNNGFYNSYANYGMSMGTPLLVSPIYNLDGYPAFACNRVQAVHIGLSGALSGRLDYRLLMGWQRGLGTYDYPYSPAREDTSVSVECLYSVDSAWSVAAQVAVDRGKLRGNNTGALVTITYKPSLR